MENVFVSAILLLSGSYIWKRLLKTSGLGNTSDGCGGCSTGSCDTQHAEQGEQALPMRR